MPSYRQILPQRGLYGWSFFIAKGGARLEKGDFLRDFWARFLGRSVSLVQGCTLYRVVGLICSVVAYTRDALTFNLFGLVSLLYKKAPY